MAGKAGGPGDPERDGTIEGAPDTILEPLPLPAPPPLPTGAEADSPLSLLIIPPACAPFSSPSDELYSDSLSPTHVFMNHRPPAIPRISRWAVRQRLTLLVDLSRGIGGAKPVGIFTGACTGNGLVGSGYCGMATFSSALAASSGRGTAVRGGDD